MKGTLRFENLAPMLHSYTNLICQSCHILQATPPNFSLWYFEGAAYCLASTQESTTLLWQSLIVLSHSHPGEWKETSCVRDHIYKVIKVDTVITFHYIPVSSLACDELITMKAQHAISSCHALLKYYHSCIITTVLSLLYHY